MGYIKIVNKGIVHRRRLEILGISIKQKLEDKLETIIGQFGSGFKMAVVVALRLNLKVAIASFDEYGPYILTFKKKRETIPYHNNVEKVYIIVYSYSDTGDRDTGISLTAFPKWTSSIGEANPYYPIVREFLTNARDEDDFFTIVRGQNICYADPGQTVVYIESNIDIENIILNRDRYFKFFYTTDAIFKISGIGAIYKKTSQDETRLFVQGCLARVSSKISSIFDYDIEDQSVLSEERSIGNYQRFKELVAKMIMSIDDLAFIESIIKEAYRDEFSFEASVIAYIKKNDISKNMQAILVNIWNKMFGVKSVLNFSDNIYNIEAEKLLGYKNIFIHNPLYLLFRFAGILNSKELVEKCVGNIENREMTEEESNIVSQIINSYLSHIKKIIDELKKYPIKTSIDRLKISGGLSDYSSIQIEESMYRNNRGEILAVLLHELRHCRSKLHDTDYRAFLKIAEEETILVLIMLRQALAKLKELGVNPADISDLFC